MPAAGPESVSEDTKGCLCTFIVRETQDSVTTVIKTLTELALGSGGPKGAGSGTGTLVVSSLFFFFPRQGFTV